MSREIKFRVWDTVEKEYFKPVYRAHEGMLLDLSVGLSGRLMRRTLEMPAEDESLFPSQYIVEQFTGLKCKNGVEIFEGDILHFNTGVRNGFMKDNVDAYKVVKFGRVVASDNTLYAFQAFYCHGKNEDDKMSIEYILNHPVLVSVIGNIHSNPELL